MERLIGGRPLGVLVAIVFGAILIAAAGAYGGAVAVLRQAVLSEMHTDLAGGLFSYTGIGEQGASPGVAVDRLASLFDPANPNRAIVRAEIYTTPPVAAAARRALGALPLTRGAQERIRAGGVGSGAPVRSPSLVRFFGQAAARPAAPLPDALLRAAWGDRGAAPVPRYARVGRTMWAAIPLVWRGRPIGVAAMAMDIPIEYASVVGGIQSAVWRQHALFLALFTALLAAVAAGVLFGMVRPLRGYADRDLLTGLFNPRAFWRGYSNACRRGAAGSCGFLMIDADNFKSVNDRFGHPAGDELLRDLARVINDHLRRVDITGRVGGEEFALALPGCREDEAVVVAERIREAVHRMELPDGTLASVSIGVSVCAAKADPRQAARHADAALYRSKRLGRNRVERYVPGMEDEVA